MKHFLLSFAILSLFASNQPLFGQTTEVFETETHNATTFTDNGQVFNITSQAMGPFHIQGSFPGFGFNGSTSDNVFIDNDPNVVGGFPIGFTIESSGDVPFIVNNFWIYLANEFANVAVSGTLTLVGKLGGSTVYSVSQSSGFNQSPGTNNGFSQINMSTFGSQNNANKPIDELVITTANNFNYVALDAFNWTVTAPEANIKGNSVSIVDGDPSPTTTDHSDFSTQSVCSGTVIRTYTVENTGTRAMTISSVNISGTHSADFTVTSSPASSVAAGGSTTFQVTFNPSASGTRSATITVNCNDANEAAYDFAIQGTGQDPEVNVQGNSTSITDGDATPSATDHTDFGSQSICSGTVVRTFTIQNTGNSNLTLGTVTIGGTHAGDFSVTASPSSPVSAAGSTTFQVTFNPSASGTRSADITFSTNDCDEATYNFNIQGAGVDPEINVQGNSNSISDGDVTPSATDHTDFGSQDMCSGTVVRTFTIQNTGSSNLTLGTVTIGGTHSGDFSVTASPSSPVSAAGSTTFQVTFDPSASGIRSADISFTANDCDETTYNFNIQGTGTDGTPTITGTTPATVCDGGTNVDLFASASSGTLNWYDATSGGTFQGTGSPLTVASVSSTTTFYVDATIGSCTSARTAVTLTVNTTPTADAPSNVTACDSYTLPALSVGNYFDGPGGTGTAYSAGNVISSSTTMYVYAETGTTPNCSDENSFAITINTTPVADDPADVTVCDSYTLPALTVGNYFDGPGGTGTAYSAGNVISSSMTMYVYAETGTTPNCSDENSFAITINTTPVADDPADVTACDSYTLPALSVGNYFDGPGGSGTAYSAGNVISSSITMYVYAETGTTPNC
ncbi:MAG: choice-of-anchor D domain-containing protein, partial [Bacteroidota bacterium]